MPWYPDSMNETVSILGGGLAGSEAALTLAKRGIPVRLIEMRPDVQTPVHRTGDLAELVCSNSLKSMREDSAPGMLKSELTQLGSAVLEAAERTRVPAGGAFAVDRQQFSSVVTAAVEGDPRIELVRVEATDIASVAADAAAVVLATGPLTSASLASDIARITGSDALAFYDAAAPIVMADSIDREKVFSQSRYEDAGAPGDYLNAPFSKDEYERFVEELVAAERVIAKEFETKELFQACQPIEEIARKGTDAPRFGCLKPVGLTDPRTGMRPWAALQLRAEDRAAQSYNLVGFQTNLTFPEQKRVFRLIPGLERAEFARYGVMHRNTFIDAPRVIDRTGRIVTDGARKSARPLFVAGQLAGTEGYCEAIRSGLNVAVSVFCLLEGRDVPPLPSETAFGALLDYATSAETKNYQPMHVNFGIMPPLERPIKNKRERYQAYAKRGEAALQSYRRKLEEIGFYVRSGG